MKKILRILMLGILVFVFTGCNKSDNFDDYYSQYNMSYINASAFVESSNDGLLTVKTMDPKLVEDCLKKMEGSLVGMKKTAKTKDQVFLFKRAETNYQGIVYLLGAHKNYEKLSIESKAKALSEVVHIIRIREKMNKGEW